MIARRTFWLPSSFIKVLGFNWGPTSLQGHSSGGLLHLAAELLLYDRLGDHRPHCNVRRGEGCVGKDDIMSCRFAVTSRPTSTFGSPL